MNSILNRLKGVFRARRINVFFVFLIIAFTILIINKLSNNYTNTIDFKINISNVPNEIILQDLEVLKIPVQFENNGFNWLKFVFKQPELNLNLQEDFNKSNDFYNWSIIKNEGLLVKKLPRFSKNIKILKDEIIINYDKLASKKIPVISNVEINFMSGHNALNEITIKPDSITLVGSKVEVDKIKKVYTKNLILNSVNKFVSQNIELEPLSELVSLSTKEVALSMEVESFTEGLIKMPIEVINKPQNLNITFFPKQVTVSFYLPLKDYKSITKENFRIICDYKKMTILNNYLNPELEIISNKIKTARIKESRVEFIISK